jgi:hypothetical protein
MENGLGWLTKAEAVNLTKVSLRTIERETAAGNIRTKQQSQVGRRSVTVFPPKEVERLRQDFTSLLTPEPSVEETSGEEQSRQLPVLRPAAEVLAAVVQSFTPPLGAQQRFLTVQEGATSAGLPAGYWWRLIHNKSLQPRLHGALTAAWPI